MMENKFPVWLQQNQYVQLPSHRRGFSRVTYLEKTLASIHRIISEDACTASINHQKGFLQRLDPHIKLIGMLAVLLSAAFSRSLVSLAALNLVLIGSAWVSNIQLRSFGIRVFLPALVLTGLPVLPGVTNWVTPGEPVFTFYSGLYANIAFLSLPIELSVTKQGLQAAAFVILRSAASLGVATLVIQTTQWSFITKALAKFGLPVAIVMVFDLTYRYIYLFLLLLMDFIIGRKSRMVGIESHTDKIFWIGGSIASFLRITKEYSEEINLAMQSRGYCGEYYPNTGVKVRTLDLCFLLCVALLSYFVYGGTPDVRIFPI